MFTFTASGGESYGTARQRQVMSSCRRCCRRNDVEMRLRAAALEHLARSRHQPLVALGLHDRLPRDKKGIRREALGQERKETKGKDGKRAVIYRMILHGPRENSHQDKGMNENGK